MGKKQKHAHQADPGHMTSPRGGSRHKREERESRECGGEVKEVIRRSWGLTQKKRTEGTGITLKGAIGPEAVNNENTEERPSFIGSGRARNGK